jgi:hypothetical protein
VTAALVAAAASLLLGIAFVLQQRAAMRTVAHSMSPRLLVDLVVEPDWLLGIALMIGGQVLGATALGLADLSVVEPLLSANLLVALAVARWMSGRQWAVRDVLAAVALTLGIAGFVLAARPGYSAPHSTSGRTVAYLGSIGVLAVACVVGARLRKGRFHAVALSAAAGLLFGLQDGMTRQLVSLFADGGLGAVRVSWIGYGVVATAVAGLTLAQSAFQAAPLAASLPPMTVAEPLVGIGYGVGVFGEPLRLAPVWLGCEAAALAAMVVGLITVSRSSLLARVHQVDDHDPGA